ncbi:MAG: quinolinate synthase NadA [Candidatus Thorarchaeota archaeon]
MTQLRQKQLKNFPSEFETELNRLYEKLKTLHWNREQCRLIAPLTLEINRLKEQKNAVILAHSYQMPQIIFGVADFVGDSLGLSREAMNVDADIIVFCGVRFMAETAKLVNPEKTVLLPSCEAGCSLAEGITAKDVQKLRAQYVDIPIVCYVNTTAAVKAECDVCVTSANAVEVIKQLDSETVIFLPDRHMTQNLGSLTGKKIIGWDAECIVHDQFTREQVQHLREQYKDIKILAHSECDPSVAAEADLVGSTGDMIRYVKSSPAQNFALITECGLSERLQIECPEKTFLGTCILCPYMKTVTLENTLQVLKSPRHNQIINIPQNIQIWAQRSLERMFALSKN